MTELARSTGVIARRGLLHMRRQPEALSDATIQPIMFVVLFAYVFGGAIEVQGGSYRSFLMGGIFAQTLTFGLFGVAMALAYDRTNGAVDRFRSLPIPRAAFLSGHAVAGLLRSLLPIVLMSIAGLIIGWRINSDVPQAVAGYALMIGWSFAMVWVGVLLAAAMRTPEGVQGVAFVFVFPITFVASTFVPVDTLPPVLRTIAEWNPVTAVAGALRELFDNPGTAIAPDSPWPIHHPIPYAVLWTLGIIAVCAPLASRMYQRSIAS